MKGNIRQPGPHQRNKPASRNTGGQSAGSGRNCAVEREIEGPEDLEDLEDMEDRPGGQLIWMSKPQTSCQASPRGGECL